MSADTLALTGIVNGLDEAIYHAHPALSSTGARQLLDSPARFHWAQSHPRAPKNEFDLGSAVHSKVLGTGYEIVTIPDDILASNGAASTAAAKAFISEAREAGRVPIKQAVAEQVNAVAEAVLAHPTARMLFEQDGNSEASVFATDPETNVGIRARFDFLPTGKSGRRICVDLKTTGTDASPMGFAKSAASWQYEVQQLHYTDTLEIATGDDDAAFVFVVVEMEAPYLVAVHQLDLDFVNMGKTKARRARELFRECTDSGVWPGYPDDINLVIPPMWSVYQFQDRYES